MKDLLASQEIENIFENSDYIYMLNQAAGDREILAKKLGISPHQLSYVTQSGEGEPPAYACLVASCCSYSSRLLHRSMRGGGVWSVDGVPA